MESYVVGHGIDDVDSFVNQVKADVSILLGSFDEVGEAAVDQGGGLLQLFAFVPDPEIGLSVLLLGKGDILDGKGMSRDHFHSSLNTSVVYRYCCFWTSKR